MIGYVTLGTQDLNRAAEFYDAIAAEMGVGRMGGDARYISWGVPGGAAGIGITLPFDGQPASVGNGVMVALEAKDRDQVDRIHALALELGGSCEGAPGERFPGFYAAYFRDRDGNKLNAFVFASELEEGHGA
ncbi:VOC family protein [Novosphingobium humi]|uniref:VOC family protein n=1 Tax=Novosphingobium humi TaxID=2282397 RepID=A0ABY7U0J8_9SPHN|nr:VOC family protein [Novosphingobium humi]WCT79055.1 VOC family protein [Novosphingobium humi]